MENQIREQLIRMLSQGEQFISGQKISEELGVSRTAIWKHISELRKDGYEVEALQKKGYRITSRPDRLSQYEISPGLQTNRIGKKIVHYDSLTSTQEIAHGLVLKGVEEGTVVLSEEQVGGRGRMGRPWYSPKGTGIWMSVILRPNIPPQKTPQLTLLTAVSIVKAIENVTNLKPDIKWPNDILINGKKAVGILTELQAEADKVNSVIIGIGMNVNVTADEFPDELKEIATSIRAEHGEVVNRAQLVREIFTQLEKLYDHYLSDGFEMIKILWESYAASIGKWITVRTLTETMSGYAKGITNEGVLLLEDNEHNIHHIYSADVNIPTS